jgi:hypothetical protein
MARIRIGNEELEFVSKSDGVIELEQGQEIPAAIFADELGRVKFRDRDSVSVFMSTLAALGGNVKQIDAAAGPPSEGLPPEVVVYIDLDTLRLYKRTESGWGTGLNLRGETGQQGQQGERGRTILYGEANPNTRIDLDDTLLGDMYAETGPENNPEHQLWVKKQPAFSEDGTTRLLQWERIGRPYGRIPEDGAQGQRGRSIFEGTSNPNSPIGLDAVEIADSVDGDLYIETDRFVIWKKIGGVWHERGQSFKGSNGQNGSDGARGNSVYEGTLDPNSLEMQSELSLAQVGDVYINTATYVVWKKKHLTGVQWEASGTTFKGTDGTSGNTIFQGAGVPNNPDTPKPQGFNNAKFGDVYLDTTVHKIWKYTSENPEAHWTEVGEPYRGVSMIQGKGDPNYLALLESEPANDLLYPDKQYDWFQIRNANIGDAYFDVEDHDLWKKIIPITDYDETNPDLDKIWVKKGKNLTGPPAETLVLESTSYFIGYDKEGKNPSPDSFTLTANLRNYPESGITYKFGTLSKDESGNVVKTQIDEEIDVNSIDINLMDPGVGGDDLVEFFGNPPAPITYYVDIYIGDQFKASDTITVLGVREGTNTLNAILSNETHVFPSDTNGNINPDVYFLGATDIYAYAGAEILEPKTETDYATSNNCFKVKIESLNGIKASNQPTNSLATSISEGQFLSNIESTGGGNYKFICFPFDWTSESKSASIVYKFYIKTSFVEGEQTFTKTQSFARLNDGNRGRSSLQGTGDPNLISRTTDPFTKTSWGVYSNSTFGVPIAEAERDYEEVLSASDGDKYVDLRTSLTYINSLKYTNTKTVALTISSPFSSLNLGHLRFLESGGQYVGDGSGPTPGTYSVVAIPRNHVGTVYYEFLLGSTTLNNSTSNALIRPISPPLNTYDSIFGNNNSITYTVRTREGSPTGAIIASDTITLVGTKANSTNVVAHITNDSITFPLDSSGVISSVEYSNISAISSIFVVEGNEKLTPVSTETNLTNSTFKISFVSSNISISPTINSFEKRILVVPSNMTGDSASVTYTITAKNSTGQEYTFTKVQTFTISKKAQSIISTWTQNQVGLLSNVEKKNQSAFSIHRSFIAIPKNNDPLLDLNSLGVWAKVNQNNCSWQFIDISNSSGEDYWRISTVGINSTELSDGNEAALQVGPAKYVGDDGSLTTSQKLENYYWKLAASSYALDSRKTTRMRMKVRRTPGVNTSSTDYSWIGRFEFVYKNGIIDQYSTGFQASNRNTQSLTILNDPTWNNNNEWVVIEWDLSVLPAWKNKTIIGMKLCLFDKPNNSIDIEWISFGMPIFSPLYDYNSIRGNGTVSGKGWVVPSTDISLFEKKTVNGVSKYYEIDSYTYSDFGGSLLRTKLINSYEMVGSTVLSPGISSDSFVGMTTSGIKVSDYNDIEEIRDLKVKRNVFLGESGVNTNTTHILGKLEVYGQTILGSTTTDISDNSTQIKGDLELGSDLSDLITIKGSLPSLIVQNKTIDEYPSIFFKRNRVGDAHAWKLSHGSDGHLEFLFNDELKSWISATSSHGELDYDNYPANALLSFTGQHKTIPSNINLLDKKYIGLIVISTGKYDNIIKNTKPSINESLPIVGLSNIRNQKSIFGVISNIEDTEESERIYQLGNFVSVSQKKSKEDNRLIINSLGEGAIWVCNINGNLENGDYITTCEIPGFGMKQDLESLMNYTVAKITCDCDFDLNSEIYHCEEFEWEGKTYRKAFVGCTYHCG